MLILGLGSNIGNQLDNLRTAIKYLRANKYFTLNKVSPLYKSDAMLPDHAPQDWNKPYLNLAVSCETTLEKPEDVLREIKQIEKQIGRTQSERWAPRIIDIDILAWGNLNYQNQDLTIPHVGLFTRPFALWPLLDVAPDWRHSNANVAEIIEQWGSRFNRKTPYNTHQLKHRVDTPKLVGILNITPDSFSDGGEFNTLDKALEHAQALFEAGAVVIDIGGESTRYGATPISPQEEWRRLYPVLRAITAYWNGEWFRPCISLDTRHYQVAEQAITLGVDWINDVTGFTDSKMRDVVANTPVKCVVMHNLGVPPQPEVHLPEYPECYQQVLEWGKKNIDELVKAGISTDRLIFDVGIDYGKTSTQSLNLLKNMNKFKALNVPLFVGYSRKPFLKEFTQHMPSERDFETALVSYHLAQQEVDYLRVHNVEMNAHALKIAAALT